ncbi:PadR family transcriptional regulator [Endothiovibrio diazotrophicus]
MTLQTLKLLRVLMVNPNEYVAGPDLRKESKLSSGTLYPILIRLEKAGWLESRWEDVDPSEAGRPRKRFYRVTRTGLQYARSALDDAGMVAPKGIPVRAFTQIDGP